MLRTGAPEAQRLDLFTHSRSRMESSSFPPSCTRRSCWGRSSEGSRRATKALLVTLLAFAAPFLASAAFTCCSGSSCTGGKSNDATTCAALGDLYTATNGAGWTIKTGWVTAAAGSSTNTTVDYCIFGGGCNRTSGALTWLCVLVSHAALHEHSADSLSSRLRAPQEPPSQQSHWHHPFQSERA